MSELPYEDQPAAMPPSETIGVRKGAAADGRVVMAMPCSNPHLGSTLDVIGFAGHGWLLRMIDPYGTLLWSLMLEGLDEPPNVSPG